MFKIVLGISLCIALEASEYIFSYQVIVKNGITIREKYYFSPVMVDANLLDFVPNLQRKCEIPHETQSEKELIHTHKDKILECFFNWGVHLEDSTQMRNLQGSSVTFLTIPPARITINYSNGIATIYALKSR